VDCGGDSGKIAADAAARALLSQGVTRLDGVILTHYDDDHAGGVEMLLSRIDADTLYLPDMDRENDIRKRLYEVYTERIHWITDQAEIKNGELKISLFPGENPEDDNESSMCILFQRKNYDILITGDRSAAGERQLLRAAELPELELLIVGHHGSGSSTSFDLLEATRPKAAAISVGAGNSYGHPDMDVLKRLCLFNCGVYRTDLDGTIIFRG